MQWQDIDLPRHLVRIRGANKNKNAPWREVPIREELIPVFEEWKAQDRQVGLGYLIHYKGKPIGSIQTTWKATLRRTGISRRIRPYDLRHAFATELIAGGTDIGTVASLMGHSTPTVLLKHYQYVMDKQKRSAVELLPSMNLYTRVCIPEKRQLQGVSVTA